MSFGRVASFPKAAWFASIESAVVEPVVGFGPAVSSEQVALFVGEQLVPVLVERLSGYGRRRLVVSIL